MNNITAPIISEAKNHSENKYITGNYVSYLAGAQMAFDSLKQAGVISEKDSDTACKQLMSAIMSRR